MGKTPRGHIHHPPPLTLVHMIWAAEQRPWRPRLTPAPQACAAGPTTTPRRTHPRAPTHTLSAGTCVKASKRTRALTCAKPPPLTTKPYAITRTHLLPPTATPPVVLLSTSSAHVPAIGSPGGG